VINSETLTADRHILQLFTEGAATTLLGTNAMH